MHRFVRLPLFLLLFAAASSIVSAQTTELQPGARIRVAAPGIVAGKYAGTLLSRSGDTLQIGGPNTAPLHVPLSGITSLEISRGTSRLRGAGRGILWGAPIGLVIGLASANSLESCSDFGCGDVSSAERSAYVVASIVGGAAWGAGIGALVGRERWEQFALLPRTSLGTSGGRSYARVTVPF